MAGTPDQIDGRIPVTDGATVFVSPDPTSVESSEETARREREKFATEVNGLILEASRAFGLDTSEVNSTGHLYRVQTLKNGLIESLDISLRSIGRKLDYNLIQPSGNGYCEGSFTLDVGGDLKAPTNADATYHLEEGSKTSKDALEAIKPALAKILPQQLVLAPEG